MYAAYAAYLVAYVAGDGPDPAWLRQRPVRVRGPGPFLTLIFRGSVRVQADVDTDRAGTASGVC